MVHETPGAGFIEPPNTFIPGMFLGIRFGAGSTKSARPLSAPRRTPRAGGTEGSARVPPTKESSGGFYNCHNRIDDFRGCAR